MSTTARFPILSFSKGIFNIIAADLTCNDLLYFSQCSKDTFDLVKNTFSGMDPISRDSLSVELTAEPAVIADNPVSYSSWWEFYGQRSFKRLELELESQDLETRSVAICNSETQKTLKFYVGWNIFFGFHDSIEDVILFAQLLADLFNLSICRLDIDAQHLDYLDLILSIDVFRKAKKIKIGAGTVTHEEMRRVLEDFEPERLTVLCSPEEGFKFEGTISAAPFHNVEEEIKAYSLVELQNHDSWFEPSMLESLPSRNLRLVSEKTGNEDLNKLLSLWLDGTYDKQIDMEVSKNNAHFDTESRTMFYKYYFWKDDDEDQDLSEEGLFDLQEIVKGLDSFIIHPQLTNRNAHFRFINPNPRSNVYKVLLQRKTDAMKILVEVEKNNQGDMCRLKTYVGDEEVEKLKWRLANELEFYAKPLYVKWK